MILKRIEIYGFKSFGKKTEINFNEPITGVVGPNGSGKSNIVDAIRWVLGEQRVKSLRGSKMEDVIFSGTQEKKALGYAQVVLYLDNSKSMFSTDYDEISVTRRLFRSGESEYYINKVLCRLKDVQEMFMDTGLGREGYSIVGQGQIESIVNSSPLERKLLIEEAAGIVKYKVRKQEAERKLERAQNNLFRISDIITELEGRVPVLKRQSEKAEKFITYKNELKDIEINLFVHRMEKLNAQAGKFYTDRDTVNTSLEELDTQIKDLDARYQVLKSQVNASDDELNDINEKIHTLLTNFENSKTEISVAKSKVETSETNIFDTSRDIGEIKKEIENLNQMKEDILGSLTDAKIAYEQSKISYDSQKKAADEMADKYRQGDQLVDRMRGQITQLEHSLDAKQQLILDLRAKIENSAYIVTQLEEEILAAQQEHAVLLDEINQKDETIEEMNRVKTLLNEKSLVRIKTSEAYDNYKEQLSQLFTRLQTDESRLKLLQGYENSMQGYRYGVRRLMQYRQNDAAMQDLVYGTVGELITTDSKYTEAIAKALGGALEYVVVENEETATKCIRLLKENKWGRVTFLPRTVIQSNGRADDAAAKQMQGFLSVASDLVKCDEPYRQIIENLLGRVLVVDGIDHAVAIANKTNHRIKLVTLEGEVFMPGGALVGGKTKDEDEGVLKRKNEMEKLTVALLELKKDYDAKLAEKESYQTKIQSAQDDFNVIQIQYDELRQQNAAKLEQIKMKKQQAEKLDSIIQSSHTRMEAIKMKTVRDKQDQMLAEKDSEKLQETLIAARQELTNYSSGAYKEDLVEVSNLRNQAEIELLKVKETVTQWQDRLLNIDEKQEGLQVQKRLKEELIDRLQEDITHLRQQIEYYTEIDRDYDGTRKELDERYARLMENKKKTNEHYIAVNDKIIAYNKERIVVAEQLSKIDVSVSKIESEIEHLQIGMMEDYALTYASALEFKKELKDYTQSAAHVAELKESIRKLGNINVEALEEYKEVKERFDTMCAQRDDLISAKEELIKIIKDISVSMVHQFMQQFDLIQKEFNDVFAILFDGGEARLILTDPENVMESGIDIIAQPPKTKLKNIAALSGGEKSMTAVSLIFAILKIKPSPFCVLDEIDAALDDANAMRFCEYLMSIKHDNQFVIITHKKKTMEIVDVLYGASMGKDGITQVFSVKMSQIGERGEVYAG